MAETPLRTWRVTERQELVYTWEVDAHTEEEAIASAEHGVPENATEEMLGSETEAYVIESADAGSYPHAGDSTGTITNAEF